MYKNTHVAGRYYKPTKTNLDSMATMMPQKLYCYPYLVVHICWDEEVSICVIILHIVNQNNCTKYFFFYSKQN